MRAKLPDSVWFAMPRSKGVCPVYASARAGGRPLCESKVVTRSEG